MQYQSFLIKYAEIGTKGKNRYIFEDALVHDIRKKLERVEGEFRVTRERGRIYVTAKSENYDYEETVDALQHVFGIVGICPMIQMENTHDYRAISDQVLTYFGEVYGDRTLTFKCRTTRADKEFPMSSTEIDAELGYDILTKYPNTTVDVHHPDVLLRVEIRQYVNIFSEVLPGAGGMPLGTNGKAMLCLSGGIDSPVAAWYMARRGLALHHIHFASPPYTSEAAKRKVETLAQIISGYTGSCVLYVVPYTTPQEYIRDHAPDVLFTVLMRRSMMRIANRIAKDIDAKAVITGESLAQVASQTLMALACTDAAQDLPVLRPLIGMDKTEIVEVARRIGTFETSILPYEDCCTIFTPPHPKTKPTLAEVEAAEADMPGLAALEEQAAKEVERIRIDMRKAAEDEDDLLL